jgi:predicted RNase H-like HicB family nuclease
MEKKVYDLTVVIEKDETGRFLALCPALQGCYTEGETIEEALELIKDAMKLHIEDRLENNEPIYQEVKTEKLSIAV